MAEPNPTPAARVIQQSALSAAIDDLLGLHDQVSLVLQGAQNIDESALTAEDRAVIKQYEEGLQKILDLIAPSAMEIKNNEVILGDLHSRTLYVYNWPNYIYPNWMSQLVNFGAQMQVSHFLYPTSNAAIMKMLRKKVAELRSSIRMLEQRGIVRDPTLEAALQDAEELRDLLARGQQKLFQFGMYITLYADEEEKLKKLQTDIESIIGGKLVLTKPAFFQMEHAFNSTLPLCLDELEITRNMNTSPIATSFPFSSSDLTDNHGILYGINRHNDSLVIFDRFDLPNANCNVFATSGAGKSFGVKLEILRSLMLGTEVLVIDPENEYVELCKTVDGSFIPMSLHSDFKINPFDLPKAIRGEDSQVGEELRASVLNLHGLFKLMLGTLTPAEDGVLDKAILDTYALKGITLQTEDIGSKEPPTLHDLVEVLETTEGGENMAKILQKYTTGSYAGLFDQATNVELEKQMVVFQIRDLEDQLRPIAIYIILNFLWNRVRAELKKRFLVIDEAWNLMQYEDSARFLFGIVKRARKYFLGITTITQDVDDFVNSPYGKPIITNSALQVLLKQSPTAVDNLQKLFYLTEGEKYVLLNSGVGQGIFFAGNKHVAIQIIASPAEASVITTKPEEVLARQAAEKAQKDMEERATQSIALQTAQADAAGAKSTEGREAKGVSTFHEAANPTPVEHPEPLEEESAKEKVQSAKSTVEPVIGEPVKEKVEASVEVPTATPEPVAAKEEPKPEPVVEPTKEKKVEVAQAPKKEPEPEVVPSPNPIPSPIPQPSDEPAPIELPSAPEPPVEGDFSALIQSLEKTAKPEKEEKKEAPPAKPADESFRGGKIISPKDNKEVPPPPSTPAV